MGSDLQPLPSGGRRMTVTKRVCKRLCAMCVRNLHESCYFKYCECHVEDW